jgi:hypothetical protein
VIAIRTCVVSLPPGKARLRRRIRCGFQERWPDRSLQRWRYSASRRRAPRQESSLRAWWLMCGGSSYSTLELCRALLKRDSFPMLAPEEARAAGAGLGPAGGQVVASRESRSPGAAPETSELHLRSEGGGPRGNQGLPREASAAQLRYAIPVIHLRREAIMASKSSSGTLPTRRPTVPSRPIEMKIHASALGSCSGKTPPAF